MYQRAWPFQFQTGAIKRTQLPSIATAQTDFQFQTGAIKRIRRRV